MDERLRNSRYEAFVGILANMVTTQIKNKSNNKTNEGKCSNNDESKRNCK